MNPFGITRHSRKIERWRARDVATAFFEAVLTEARAQRLLSDEHFTVDGTLLEAWASQKSFQPKAGAPRPPDDPGNPTVNFRGQRRTNATHQSTTDPEARLYKKGGGRPAQLAYLGHVLMENRCGLITDTRVTVADGFGERDAALSMVADLPVGRVTLGGDKGYDSADFVCALRAMTVTPHVAQNTAHRRSAIDARTTRHPGYALSQRTRKQVEEAFGWLKSIALLRKLRHRGRAKVAWIFRLAAAAYNLIRIRNLVYAAP